MKKIFFLLFILIISSSLHLKAFAQDKTVDNTWDNWQFLMGDWVSVQTGEPGEGTAFFSFYLHLDSNVLYRADHNEFPATDTRKAFYHDDILIIYKESSDIPNKAIYFDNENHVIHYNIEYPEKNKSIILSSEESKGKPRQKLSYFLNDDGSLKIKFELATPDKPDDFKVHVEGTARKK